MESSDFATYRDLQIQANKQRNQLLFRLFPTAAYRWLADDDFVPLEEAEENREASSHYTAQTISDAEVTLWKLSGTIGQLQDNAILFDVSLPDTLDQVEKKRSQFQSRRNKIPAHLLTPVEHAHLYHIDQYFQTVIDTLRAVIQLRQEAAEPIHNTIVDAHYAVLQVDAMLQSDQAKTRTFYKQISVGYQLLIDSQSQIADTLGAFPVTAFRPTELSRLFDYRSQITTKKNACDSILEERQRARDRLSRAKNDLRHSMWEAEQYLGDGSFVPALPAETAEQINQLETNIESLRAEVSATHPSVGPPVEYASAKNILLSAEDRLTQLKKQQQFEQAFRNIRNGITTFVQDIRPHFTTDEYWPEAGRQTVQVHLKILSAQLQAVQLVGESAEDVTVQTGRISRLQQQLTALQSHEKLDIEQFRRVRTDAVGTLYQQLSDIETLYWGKKEEVENYIQSESWSEHQRSQTVPSLITTLRSAHRDIAQTVSDLPSQAVRPNEYGKLHGYQLRLESTLQTLQHRQHTERILHTVARISENIASKAEPYLRYEKLCPESELTEIQKQLSKASREFDALHHLVEYEELTDRVKDRAAGLSEQLVAYQDHFTEYNRDYVTQLAEQHLSEFTTLHEDLETQLRPVRKHGEPLPEEIDSQAGQVRTIVNKLGELTEPPTERYLATRLRNNIEGAQTDLKASQRFINQKAAFETEIQQHQNEVQQVTAKAVPFLNHEQFLTLHTRKELAKLVRNTRSDVDTWQDEFDFSLLASADKQKPEELIDTLIDIARQIRDRDAYNAEFVEAARDRNVDLFSAIDAAGNDLTLAQQRAIVRNGVYNQVIAGAGTGKTLALIYRIGYLVLRKGIDPSRITVVTLTNKATDEIEDRLATRFDITGVSIQTLHSFGLDIIGDATSENIELANGDLRNLLDRLINGDGHEEFKTHLRQFIQHDQTEYLDEDDFETRADYIAERANKDYLTLAGEEVASRAEKVIADFLFEHQIKYRYEEVAEWADTAPDKKSYEPDFHLPEHDLYLEHWAIDEDGAVPAWFDMRTAEYKEKRTWARAQFESADPGLIETYDSEHHDGRLRARLKEILSEQDIELEPLSFEQLVDHAHEYHETEKRLKQQFKQFVQNAKIFSKDPNEIREEVSEADPRQYHFAQCGAYALSEYELFLDRTGRIDFQDMLSKAATAIEKQPNRFQRRFDHILVDEFQDISVLGHQLISALVPSNQDAIRLFTVGDDWQSIYGFRGAVVDRFVNFEEVFGQPTQTKLTRNHRSPDPVVRAGNELLTNNSNQIEKAVEPAGTNATEPVLHTLCGKNGSDRDYRQRVGEYVAKLIKSFIDDGVSLGEIMVLCRFDRGARYLNRVKKSLKGERIPFDGEYEQYRPDDQTPEGAVDVHTIHKAKGREAEKVILVHAAGGKYGIPSNHDRSELLAPARDVEINRIAEERRLFYVAMTRTKDELHVTTRRHQRSRYLDEVFEWFDERRSVAYPGPDGERTSLTAKVEHLWDTHPTQHQVGVLTDPTGAVKFVSWARADPATLKKGRWYRLDGLKVNDSDEYGMQVMIDEKTVVEDPIDTG